MTSIPYIVAVACALIALRLPRGKDLYVPIALIPFRALEVEIGLSIQVSELLMMLLVARHFLCGRIRPSTLPAFSALVIFMLLAVAAAVATMEFGPDVPAFAGGGVMRNGYGRVVTTFCKAMLLFAVVVLITSNRKTIDPFLLLKAYVYSCVCLALLGLVQIAVFITQGVDIFPIAMFQASDAARSAIVSIHGQDYLRVCSLGGEPKGLGQALAVALCILWIFADSFAIRRSLFLLMCGTLLTVTVLTSSASAFITLLLVAGFIYVFSRKLVAFNEWGVKMTLTIIAAILVTTFYCFAAFTDTLSTAEFAQFDSYIDSLVFKVTDRIKLGDTDALVMESFVDCPFGLTFGRGLGLVHHYAHSFVPKRMEYYLQGQLIVPKSGIAYFVGYGGVLGLFFIIRLFSGMIPVRSIRSHRSSKMPATLMRGMQALSFGLFATLLLRLYARDIIWITMACVSVIHFQYMHGIRPLRKAGSHSEDATTVLPRRSRRRQVA